MGDFRLNQRINCSKLNQMEANTMCTTGAVATFDSQGKPVVFALKTSDYIPSGIWHGIIQGSKGYDILGSQRWEVSGVNAGMNRKGLAVLRAYLGYQ
jgi:hypothetical protein